MFEMVFFNWDVEKTRNYQSLVHKQLLDVKIKLEIVKL